MENFYKSPFITASDILEVYSFIKKNLIVFSGSEKVSELKNLERQIWRSNTYNYSVNYFLGKFNGFYTLIDEDVKINTSSGNLIEYTTPFSASNIINRLTDFYSAINPLQLADHYNDTRSLSIHLAPQLIEFLTQALKEKDPNADTSSFFGIPFVESASAWGTDDGDDARITLLTPEMTVYINTINQKFDSSCLQVQYIYPEHILHAKVDLIH